MIAIREVFHKNGKDIDQVVVGGNVYNLHHGSTVESLREKIGKGAMDLLTSNPNEPLNCSTLEFIEK